MTINCDNIGQVKVTIIAIGTELGKKGHELILEGVIFFIEDKVEKLLESANDILTINGFELSGYEVIEIDIPELGKTYGV